jgi:hypothetical protein
MQEVTEAVALIQTSERASEDTLGDEVEVGEVTEEEEAEETGGDINHGAAYLSGDCRDFDLILGIYLSMEINASAFCFVSRAWNVTKSTLTLK